MSVIEFMVAMSVLLISIAAAMALALSAPGRARNRAAQANLRSALPAIEAYYADQGTYAGISVELLRAVYEPGLGDVSFALATASEYCVETTVGSSVFFKNGPHEPIAPGTCPHESKTAARH